MSKFKIGEKVKLKDYNLFGDYKRHDGETAIITKKERYFSFEIAWNDKETSLVNDNNLIKAEVTSWREELQ